LTNNFSSGKTTSRHFASGENPDPKQRILDAALSIFIEKGLEGARTREIAEAAEVNLAMLHYYFGSKALLYRQVVRPLFLALVGFLASALSSSDDPGEQLEALVDAYFDFLGEYPDLPRLMMWELAAGGKNLQTVFKPLLQQENVRLPDRLTDVFKSGQESGAFRLFPPEQGAISLVALCVFPFLARPVIATIFPDSQSGADFIEERRRHVKTILMRGLSADNSNSVDG
jgi:AcrR family transcriptional regulator